MVIVGEPVAWLAATCPPVLDASEASLIERRRAPGGLAFSQDSTVDLNQNAKEHSWRQQQPGGQNTAKRADAEGHGSAKRGQAGISQARVSPAPPPLLSLTGVQPLLILGGRVAHSPDC